MGFALSAIRRSLAFRFHRSILYRWRYAGSVPDRLVIAPIDLRTADPTAAHDIYAGRWVFDSDGVDVSGFSVFDAVPPSDAWARSLHSFGWLRHLRATDIELSRSNARTLIQDWIRYSSRRDRVVWDPEVVARRLMAWLSQAPLILDGCDYPFYRRFMKSLMRQVRYLRRVAYNGAPGLPRLRVMMALASVALSLPDQSRFLKQASRRLDSELSAQILPDGGHISRSPAALLEAIIDLLPLRQAFTARNVQPSRALVSAIDRMMPMLRFFRLGDGSFAHFNGAGDTATERLATVLAYDDVRAALPENAPHSGYQRMEAGGTFVIVDSGRPPRAEHSLKAHAGCLSFEMSVGRQRLIVNCGVPRPDAASLRRLARTTVAHSTATLNDTSSCRLARGSIGQMIGEAIIGGPTRVDIERSDAAGATILSLSHNGYVDRYHIVHHRELSLSDSGDRLEGLDSFTSPSGGPANKGGKDYFAIRFHLHPDVRASVAEGGHAVVMELPDGESWEFETDGPEVVIEESIMLSNRRGNRATEQVVIYGRVQQAAHITWHLHRTALGGRRQRLIAAGEAEMAERS